MCLGNENHFGVDSKTGKVGSVVTYVKLKQNRLCRSVGQFFAISLAVQPHANKDSVNCCGSKGRKSSMPSPMPI